MKKLACSLVLCAFAVRAAAPPPPPPEAGGSGFRRNVRLRLLSDDARVELRDAFGKTVCKTPCNADVPMVFGDSFTLAGTGLRSSEPFTFEAQDTDVTLRVHAGSSGRVLGYVIGGVGAAVAGFSLLALGFESVAVDGDGVNHGATSGPVAGLAIGALVLAIGGLIILNTRQTSFTREP